MELFDRYGRRMSYLRLSVTDRCNLRCQYCMPAEGSPKLHHSDILSYEDLYRIASAAVAMGIDKIRLTGGEPLVRKGLLPFIERLSALPGLKELVLTTNGLLLDTLARPLREAGVQRLNISLDSLREERFSAITRGGDLQKVLAGIEAARNAGFPDPKINMVVMRGVNDDEVLDFAALTLDRSYTVRFIEYMPTLQAEEWANRCIDGADLQARIAEQHQLLPLVSSEGAGPARNFRIAGAAGAIGFITPISGHFCSSCNRIRVSSTGIAQSCLFAKNGTDLRPALQNTDDMELRQRLARMIAGKPQGHHIEKENGRGHAFAMSGIGG